MFNLESVLLNKTEIAALRPGDHVGVCEFELVSVDGGEKYFGNEHYSFAVATVSKRMLGRKIACNNGLIFNAEGRSVVLTTGGGLDSAYVRMFGEPGNSKYLVKLDYADRNAGKVVVVTNAERKAAFDQQEIARENRLTT